MLMIICNDLTQSKSFNPINTTKILCFSKMASLAQATCSIFCRWHLLRMLLRHPILKFNESSLNYPETIYYNNSTMQVSCRWCNKNWKLTGLIHVAFQSTYLKIGLVLWIIPSLDLSLALVNRTDQSFGRKLVSTAKPWFWDVMKQRCVSSWIQGWLCPRFPYLSKEKQNQMYSIQEMFSKYSNSPTNLTYPQLVIKVSRSYTFLHNHW